MELVRECGDIVNMDEQEDGGLLNILIISLTVFNQEHLPWGFE